MRSSLESSAVTSVFVIDFSAGVASVLVGSNRVGKRVNMSQGAGRKA